MVPVQVACGQSPNGTDIMDWTKVEDLHEIIIDGLDLEEGHTYYFTVEATNVVGLKTLATTDGLTVCNS